MNYIAMTALAFAIGGCAMPETVVTTGSPRPQLAIKGAPADATLAVDGLSMGSAAVFDGNPKVLLLEEGMHQVEIRRGSEIIHSEKTFVGSGEVRVINVGTGIR
ncbi:MAG: hypothetical protein V4695_01415 [Pseudomonadota bacterium]